MAKNNQPKNNQPEKNQQQAGTEQQKVQTKYDRKMEARKKQEEKDRREAKMMRIGAMAVCAVIVLAIAGSVVMSVWNKKTATRDTYVTIGGHEITKLEYDYHYHAVMNNYSGILSYMGVDVTSDLSQQQYTEDLTWKDFFDEMTVEQLKQSKALADDAAANGFSYDVSEEYANTVSTVQANAQSAGVSASEYYKQVYGDYATEKNMEPFIKEDILTSAYYNHLTEQNVPEAQEIKEYYEQNKLNYDKVDYRSFVFSAEAADDAAEEDTAGAMSEAREKADAMLDALQKGGDFRQLCLENAAEADKASYEDAETDASLSEGAFYSGTPIAISGWLYEDGRAQGDRTVIEDTSGNRVYVLEFVNRYYDEADDANISNTIANQNTSEYVNNLAEGYAVADIKGDLKYLTVDTADRTGEAGADGVQEDSTGTGEEEAGENAAGGTEETGAGESAADGTPDAN